jgi:hypothetical protein
MKKRFVQILVLVLMFTFVGMITAEAAQYGGMILVKRDSSRKIIGCALDTGRTDAAGKPIRYMLVMDENGIAIAQQHENKDVKIEGTLSGNNLKALEWQEVREGYFDNSYVAPASEKEPSENGDEGDGEESYTEDEEEYDEDGNPIKKPGKKPTKPTKNEDDEDSEEEYNDEGDSENDSESEEEPVDDSENNNEETYDEEY